MPGALTTSPDQASEYARIQTDVNTYVNEMMLKFIVGEEPLSNFEKYISELNNRGLERMLSMTQDAYNRYLAR